MHDNIRDFPGQPDALFRQPKGTAAYGLQPNATPLLEELVNTLHTTLDGCPGHRAEAAKAAMRGYACDPALLSTAQKQGAQDSYKRHLLYAAPDRSFSLLAIVWLPGQITPIHGHTAWGAVAVVEGHPFVENFDRWEDAQGAINLRSKLRQPLQPGHLAAVRPGIDDLHRLGNDSNSRAITLHAYGRDLLVNADRLNIIFNH